MLPNTHENTHEFTVKYVLGIVESLKTLPGFVKYREGKWSGQLKLQKFTVFLICTEKTSAWLEASYHEAFYKFTHIFLKIRFWKRKTQRIMKGTHRSRIFCSQHAQHCEIMKDIWREEQKL